MSVRVAINGFGRIGRAPIRILTVTILGTVHILADWTGAIPVPQSISRLTTIGLIAVTWLILPSIVKALIANLKTLLIVHSGTNQLILKAILIFLKKITGALETQITSGNCARL